MTTEENELSNRSLLDILLQHAATLRKRKINREAMMPKPSKSSPVNRWSGRVTHESSALDLEKGVFTWEDPKRIALSLKQSADISTRRKTPPFRSAMSMLVFYINRAGKNLDKDRLRILEQAKEELRTLYGKSRYK